MNSSDFFSSQTPGKKTGATLESTAKGWLSATVVRRRLGEGNSERGRSVKGGKISSVKGG